MANPQICEAFHIKWGKKILLYKFEFLRNDSMKKTQINR